MPLAGPVGTISFVKNVASSGLLARALQAAGFTRPAESVAHHIVAGGAAAAGQARAILQSFGININSAANGVFLPATKASLNPTGAAVHSTLHTNQYYQTVNQMLGASTNAAEANTVLSVIRQMLLTGGI